VDGRFTATLHADVRRDRYVAGINSLLQLLTNAAPLLLLWLGVGAVNEGQLSLGQMLGLVALASSSLVPLDSLAHYINQGQQIWAYLERLADVWDTAVEETAVDETMPGPLVLQGAFRSPISPFAMPRMARLGCPTSPLRSLRGRKWRLWGRQARGRVPWCDCCSACIGCRREALLLTAVRWKN
jgi:ABC-type multidrug transport system fused ATPase/permease subunit